LGAYAAVEAATGAAVPDLLKFSNANISRPKPGLNLSLLLIGFSFVYWQ